MLRIRSPWWGVIADFVLRVRYRHGFSALEADVNTGRRATRRPHQPPSQAAVRPIGLTLLSGEFCQQTFVPQQYGSLDTSGTTVDRRRAHPGRFLGPEIEITI